MPAPRGTGGPTNAIVVPPPKPTPAPRAEEPWRRVEAPEEGNDGFKFTDGSKVAGSFPDVENGVIRRQMDGLREPVRLRAAGLAGLTLRVRPRVAARAPAGWLVLLADGSLLPARKVTVEDGRVIADGMAVRDTVPWRIVPRSVLVCWHGELLGITNGVFRWQHPAAIEPFTAPLAEALRIFPPARPLPGNAGAEPATVRLSNGDVISPTNRPALPALPARVHLAGGEMLRAELLDLHRERGQLRTVPMGAATVARNTLAEVLSLGAGGPVDRELPSGFDRLSLSICRERRIAEPSPGPSAPGTGTRPAATRSGSRCSPRSRRRSASRRLPSP